MKFSKSACQNKIDAAGRRQCCGIVTIYYGSWVLKLWSLLLPDVHAAAGVNHAACLPTTAGVPSLAGVLAVLLLASLLLLAFFLLLAFLLLLEFL
jgi:hypothetical protein